MYRITDYSKQKAKQLNVNIKPSNKKNKKDRNIKNTAGFYADKILW